jgi:hypothetical protein
MKKFSNKMIKCIVVITEEIFELLVKKNISLNKLNENVKDYLNEDISFKLYSEMMCSEEIFLT